MKKKVKDIKIGELVAECRKHISCVSCPFINIVPCNSNYGAIKDEFLNKKIEVK